MTRKIRRNPSTKNQRRPRRCNATARNEEIVLLQDRRLEHMTNKQAFVYWQAFGYAVRQHAKHIAERHAANNLPPPKGRTVLPLKIKEELIKRALEQ